MRVRSLANVLLLCALVVCAIQSDSSRAFEAIHFSIPFDGAQPDFVNTLEKPPACSSLFVSKTLFHLGRPAATDVSRFSQLTF